MANWLCPVDEGNWGIILENRMWGVSDQYTKLLNQVRLGDALVFFIKDSMELRGIYRVNSLPFESSEPVMLDDSAFPAKVRFRVTLIERVMTTHRVDLQELLTFHDGLQSLQAWLLSQIGKPLVPITDEEFQIIYDVLVEASSVIKVPKRKTHKSWQYYRWASRSSQGW